MPFQSSLFAGLAAFALVVGPVGCGSAADEDDADGEGVADESALTLEGYEEPTEADLAEVSTRHPDLDPDGIVPRDLLTKAVAFRDKNESRIANFRWVSVIDFSRHSSKQRFFIIDMNSGKAEGHVMAHGSGSDPGHSGYARSFSNREGSNASSVGYYLTGETYSGNNGRSLRLDGVSDTNSNARARAVVIHGADYVAEGRTKQGRSWGCPAVAHRVRDAIINRIRGGSVIYAERAGREEN